MKYFSKDNLLAIVITITISACAFAALHFEVIGYGTTLFILTPISIGYFIGQKPGWWKLPLFFSAIIGFVAFGYLLISLQIEGFLCLVMLFPLIFACVFVGMWIGYFIRKWLTSLLEKKDTNLAIYPLVLLLFSGIIEHYFIAKYNYGKVESKITLPYSKEKVFDFIKSVDTLDTDKTFLLKLGLSVPQKCVLEKEEPGAKRICYFDGGTIDEKVLEIRRGEILKMEVTGNNLPGFKWLRFLEATYLFEEKDGKTILTRITTFRTELKPRFYWSFWEEKSIEAEHEYVLHDLEQRLAKDAGRQQGHSK